MRSPRSTRCATTPYRELAVRRSHPEQDLLLRVLISPTAMVELGEPEWDALLPRARASRLLARLAAQEPIAAGPTVCRRRAPRSVDRRRVMAAHNERLVRWEVNRIEARAEAPAPPESAAQGARPTSPPGWPRPRDGSSATWTSWSRTRPGGGRSRAAGRRLAADRARSLRSALLPQLDARAAAAAPPSAGHRGRPAPRDPAADLPPKARPRGALGGGAALDRASARPGAGRHGPARRRPSVPGRRSAPRAETPGGSIGDLLGHFGADPGFWRHPVPRAAALRLGQPFSMRSAIAAGCCARRSPITSSPKLPPRATVL